MNNYTYHEKQIVEKYNTSFDSKDSFSFMNDGYCDLDSNGFPCESTDIEWTEKFVLWKYQCNLYKKSLESAGVKPNTDQGTLLDLSCGHGGGLEFIKDYYKFKKLIGIDLNPTHIDLCKKHITDVEFITASATDMPLESNSVDAITVIEAVPYFNPIEKFVLESQRILTQNGFLILTHPHRIDHSSYINHGYSLFYESDITENVRMSSAISKYIMLNNKRNILYECLFYDEFQFNHANVRYYLTVYQKN
jgi:SAM-dependent methyltransferase